MIGGQRSALAVTAIAVAVAACAFYSARSTGRDSGPPDVSRSGFYVIDNRTGDVVGFGYP